MKKTISKIACLVVAISLALGSLDVNVAFAKTTKGSNWDGGQVGVTKRSCSSVKLRWKKQPEAKKYKVSYRKKGGKWKSRVTKGTSTVLTKIKTEATYQVRVRAYCESKVPSTMKEEGEAKTADLYGISTYKREDVEVKADWSPWSPTSSFFMVGKTVYSGKPQAYKQANRKQKAIVRACKSIRSTSSGWCAKWVTFVYLRAGMKYFDGDSCDMYKKYCTSSNKDELKVGMLVTVSTHALSYLGRRYGHSGIYIGDGKVMHSSGKILTTKIDDWIKRFGGRVSVKWGFPYRDIA